MNGNPPEGFAVRSATVDDAGAIAELINEVTVAEIGMPWTTADEVRDRLTAPGGDAALPDVVLADDDGAMAGFLEYVVTPEPPQVQLLVFVPARLWSRGLSAWLLGHGEASARAAVRSDEGVVRASRFTGNEPAGRLFAALGYAYARTFWVMSLELDPAPPAPKAPTHVAIRTFDADRDAAATYDALVEAFADHWGGGFPPFDEWRHEEIEGAGADFDATLWFVAEDGDQVVGAAVCRATSPRAEGTAQVLDLGVRRPWRRRGIALALLTTAFAELHRRGIPRVELTVDADSPTGATRLYERAGMREVFSWEVWEKPLGRG